MTCCFWYKKFNYFTLTVEIFQKSIISWVQCQVKKKDKLFIFQMWKQKNFFQFSIKSKLICCCIFHQNYLVHLKESFKFVFISIDWKTKIWECSFKIDFNPLWHNFKLPLCSDEFFTSFLTVAGKGASLFRGVGISKILVGTSLFRGA